MKNIHKNADRYSRYDVKRDKKSKKNLRNPLNLGEIVYVLLARFKKKKMRHTFYKSSKDKESSFNKNKKFVVTHRFENHRGMDFYRVQELETGVKLKGKPLRKELFALENNVK